MTDDGQIILAAEGNGCANDIPFDGIEGWTDDEISAMYGDIGVDAMRSAIDELRDGSFEDEADWLTNWLERFVKAMETSGGSDD